jgi:hypothetical protein
MCWTAIALFPTKPALSFIPQNRGGDLGISHFTAANPPVGAQITFNLQDAVTTKLAERQRRDRAAIARGETPPYPTHEQLRAEAEKEAPATIVSIADSAGKVIRPLDAPAGRGLQRITWDILAQSTQLAPAAAVAGGGGRGGALVVPGKYTVSLARRVDGVITPLPGTQTLEVAAEDPATKEDRVAMADFHEKLGRLQKAPTTTTQSATEAGTRLSAIRRAIDATPSLPSRLREETLKLEKQLNQDQHHAQRRPRLARHQRRRPGIHLRLRPVRRISNPRDHRPAHQDCDRTISNRERRPCAEDSQTAQTF